jgi:DNA oxidative demethylase
MTLSGLHLFPGKLNFAQQKELIETLRKCIVEAPFFTPLMPGNGRPFSVRMTNLGPLGWVSDKNGFRYQPTHPDKGTKWPPIPASVIDVWNSVSGYPYPPEACLVNFYQEGTKMGLHQDKDEDDFSAPVVSISLGDTALFRVGGTKRGGKTRSLKLASGDVLVMGGESRLAFHGIDRVLTGTSTLLKDGGRINLTLRRVTKPPSSQ